MYKLDLKEVLSVGVRRNRNPFEGLPLKGKWHCELWRPTHPEDPKGVRVYKLEDIQDFENDICTTAKNTLLDTMFNFLTQTAAANWCAGLVSSASFTGYTVATDTMASHPGWTEFTNYSQSSRVAWGQTYPTTGASISNSSPMVFDMNATGTIQGLFITTNNTKGGTTGLLWSAASYTSTVAVISGDEIRSTYTLSC